MENSMNVMQKVAEAAKKAGAMYPEAVAEYLKDRVAVVETQAGPQIVVRNGLECESLDGVFARMQVTENVGAMFNGGKFDVRTMDHELYSAIRKHNPELFGLRKKR
jgi:hypothetical protein